MQAKAFSVDFFFVLIEAKLKANERDKINTIIKNNFEEDDTGSVLCEEIHVVVEEELGYSVDYVTIEQIFLEIFKPDNAKAGDYRYLSTYLSFLFFKYFLCFSLLY